MKYVTKTRVTLVLIVAAFVYAAFFFDEETAREESNRKLETAGCVTSSGRSSPERNLALIEEDDPCPSELTVNRFRSILDRLETQCAESPRSFLGDMIVRGQQLLFEEGVEASLREIGSALDRATAGQTGATCAEVLSIYIAQRSRTG